MTLPGMPLDKTDVRVGQRIWMDTHHPVHKKGYITYPNHIVVKVSLYNQGSVHCFTVRPAKGGLDEHVEARRVIGIRLLQDAP